MKLKTPIKLTIIGSVILLITFCNSNNDKNDSKNQEFKITEVIEENLTETVNIEKFNLVSNPNEDRNSDAAQILNLKRKWPQIMQSPNNKAFDSILSKNFVSIDNGRLLSRANYIKDRTTPSEWQITYVNYKNLTLQFFDDIAILSYLNQVRNEHVKNGEIEVENISWVDTYIKESGQWKIASAHVIDIDVEKIK